MLPLQSVNVKTISFKLGANTKNTNNIIIIIKSSSHGLKTGAFRMEPREKVLRERFSWLSVRGTSDGSS